MILTSSSFEHNSFIPKKFSAEGGNINPELTIQNVPEEAKSLALILHDPDAPVPGGFTHWVVWNIDSRTTVIKQESVPPGGVEGTRGGGGIGYTGPLPPSGIHRYEFRLYALDAMLGLPSAADKNELEAEIKKHLLAETTLIGLYKKESV